MPIFNVFLWFFYGFLWFFYGFLWFFYDLWFFWGFKLFPSAQLMIPDRLQYFLEHLWNDQKCNQIWTLGPCIYHPNTSNDTRNYGNIVEKRLCFRLVLSAQAQCFVQSGLPHWFHPFYDHSPVFIIIYNNWRHLSSQTGYNFRTLGQTSSLAIHGVDDRRHPGS